MNRSVLFVVAFAIALAAPVSAGTFYRYVAPAAESPKTAAGIVASDGTVVSGTGFTVEHAATGVYHISFSRGFFPTGCAAIVAQSFAYGDNRAIVANSYVSGCENHNPIFHVALYVPMARYVDRDFQFIVVGT